MDWKSDSYFPDRLRQVREAAGLSQQEFARRVGISRSAISLYETGDRIPDISIVDRIIEEFGCSYDFLMGRAAAMTTPERESLSRVAELSNYSLNMILQMSNYLNLVNEVDRDALAYIIQALSFYATGDAYRVKDVQTYPDGVDVLDILARVDEKIVYRLRHLRQSCQEFGYKRLTKEEREDFRLVLENGEEESEDSAKKGPLYAGAYGVLESLFNSQVEDTVRKFRAIDEDYRRLHNGA